MISHLPHPFLHSALLLNVHVCHGWVIAGYLGPEVFSEAICARQAGLAVVMNLCILKEHAKRFRLTRQ